MNVDMENSYIIFHLFSDIKDKKGSELLSRVSLRDPVINISTFYSTFGTRGVLYHRLYDNQITNWIYRVESNNKIEFNSKKQLLHGRYKVKFNYHF